MSERYCPSGKPRFDGESQCYYHGEELTCPYCGTHTIPVNEGEYKPQRGDYGKYTLREIGG